MNPFQVTKPVQPSDVIGREKEKAQLVALAVAGNNARVTAPRRYGKTSLLMSAQQELCDEGWLPIYVDLLGIISVDDFSARIEHAYTKQLKGAVAQWFVGKRRQLKPTVSAGGGPVPIAVTLDLSGSSEEVLIERLSLPAQVYERTGSRVHVVFDEFQEIDRIPRRMLTSFCAAASSIMAMPLVMSSQVRNST